MSLSKDLVLLILQFCDEENLKKTAHVLEQETGYFFDLKYFEELVLDGNWKEAEKYLSSFTVVDDNKYATKIYFEIRKQKFLEALDRHEHSVALDILLNDLKVFAQSNKELYKEMAQLLAFDDFREHNSLAFYGDTLSARKRMLNELRNVIEANPLLQGRTKFPDINKSRLRRLINQSLNWQHLQCAHPHPQPHIDTLFTDHKCPGPDTDTMQDQLFRETSLVVASQPVMVSASPFTPTTSYQSSVTESKITARPLNIGNLFNQAADSGDSEISQDANGLKSIKPVDEAESSADFFSSHFQDSENELLPIEFPRTVERILYMGSQPTSMDFHPVHHTMLLVGKSVGTVELWEITSANMVGEIKSGSGVSLENLVKNPVNRVRWSPDGTLFGVAYSKGMLHLYLYHHKNGNNIEKQFEIDAHVGSVNDLAFSKPHDKLVIASCGDDKLIKVWDAATGAKQYTFEGHGAPVYSVCPRVKENVHFLFSTSTSGEIKAWLFDNMGSRVTYNAPGFCCMRMAYSSDGERLFSCGTNENGESNIVEWNESEGIIIRDYNGLAKCSSSLVQFDTSSNRFLAAGDNHLIKIWDMNNEETLAVIDADGGLPASPYICLNKNGSLLAVSADHNQIKILANVCGHELLQTESSGYLTESFRKLSVNPTSRPLEAIAEEGDISTVVEVSRCQSVLLTSQLQTNVIRRLVYTNAGNAVLALAEHGIHLLWRWARSDANMSGEATTKCTPQLWQPKSGLLMINDLPKNSSDVVTPCFTLSKNDSYVISASGGMISLYNMLIFKKLRSVMAPPPAATCIVFYPPDNNIIGIGFDDSTILIYNIREDQIISKLEGHTKRVSGLAFATSLNLLVSCGVDTQIVVWDSVSWEKKKSTVLQISVGSDMYIELEKDEKQFLAVHETQLAIYETATLRRVNQWTIANFCTRISQATLSCDSELVYAVMRDGIVIILDASELAPRYELDPSSYLPASPSLSTCVNPVVIAAHPKKPTQFALGLSNGDVVVIEPTVESQCRWSALPPVHEDKDINVYTGN